MSSLRLVGSTMVSSRADHRQTLLFSSNQQFGRRRSSSVSTSYFKSTQLKHYYGGRRWSKPVVITACSSSCPSSDHKQEDDDDVDDYYESVILMAETLRHYQQKSIHGSLWKPSIGRLLPLCSDKEIFISIFQNPTIFLKISDDCDKDFILPVDVGNHVLEKIIPSWLEEEEEEFPDEFQLLESFLGKPGYQVKLVKLTKTVDNIYTANICFHKSESEDITLDASPADAINIAKHCRAPIYVSKQIDLASAGIKLFWVTGVKTRHKRPAYEVSLDSAIDGPDILEKELPLAIEMILAAKEERYRDAAMWRDKILKLQSSPRKE